MYISRWRSCRLPPATTRKFAYPFLLSLYFVLRESKSCPRQKIGKISSKWKQPPPPTSFCALSILPPCVYDATSLHACLWYTSASKSNPWRSAEDSACVCACGLLAHNATIKKARAPGLSRRVGWQVPCAELKGEIGSMLWTPPPTFTVCPIVQRYIVAMWYLWWLLRASFFFL